jgi:hypothetical protein
MDEKRTRYQYNLVFPQFQHSSEPHSVASRNFAGIFTAVCKKVGGRRFWKSENKQDTTNPKLGFALPGAR